MTRKTGALISAILGIVVVVIPVTVGVCTGSIHFKRLLESPEVHHHQWGQWGQPQNQSDSWIQFRSCTNCGMAELRHVQWSK